jgi:hypothetical protein
MDESEAATKAPARDSSAFVSQGYARMVSFDAGISQPVARRAVVVHSLSFPGCQKLLRREEQENAEPLEQVGRSRFSTSHWPVGTRTARASNTWPAQWGKLENARRSRFAKIIQRCQRARQFNPGDQGARRLFLATRCLLWNGHGV